MQRFNWLERNSAYNRQRYRPVGPILNQFEIDLNKAILKSPAIRQTRDF